MTRHGEMHGYSSSTERNVAVVVIAAAIELVCSFREDAAEDAALTAYFAPLFHLPLPVNIFAVPPTHHPTPRAALSRILRLMIKATTRRKKPSAAKMSNLSYQSAFSICLTRLPAVDKRPL